MFWGLCFFLCLGGRGGLDARVGELVTGKLGARWGGVGQGGAASPTVSAWTKQSIRFVLLASDKRRISRDERVAYLRGNRYFVLCFLA